MCTGVIEQKDTVLKVDSTMDDTELTINNNGVEDRKEVDSVAMIAVCMTAYEITERSFKVTMSNETKRITSLKDVKDGAAVNVERALKLSDRLGGHLVSGHVDATGTITEISHDGNAVIMKVKCPARLMK